MTLSISWLLPLSFAGKVHFLGGRLATAAWTISCLRRPTVLRPSLATSTTPITSATEEQKRTL